MIGKDKKQQEIERLEKFILGPKTMDYHSFLGYNSLRNKYPFQYLRLLKKHRNEKKGLAESEADNDRIYVAESWINEMIASFHKYLIMPPGDDDEKRIFNMLANRLEELILKQNKEN